MNTHESLLPVDPAGTIETGARRDRFRWAISGILLLVVLSGFFDRISIAVLFSNKDFTDAMGTGFDPTLLGLLMTSFLVAYGISGVFLSWTVDLYGPGRMLGWSVVVWGVMMALVGTASGFVTTIAYRIVLGLSEGPQFSIANALVQRWFKKSERARANSLWTIGSPLGSAIGFPLTIWLVGNFGWRASFFALAVFNLLIVLPLVLVFARKDPPKPIEATNSGLSYRESIMTFLRDPKYWLVTFFGCGVLIYLWGVNSWLPSYLMRAHNMDPAQTSFYAALPFVLTIIGQFGGAWLSDRIGRRAPIAGIGLILAGLCVGAAPYMPQANLAALMIALGGFFWGGATPVKYALLGDILPASSLATGVGITNGIGNLVGALAPLAIGWIISLTGSFDSGFLVIVFASIIGGLALTPLMRRY